MRVFEEPQLKDVVLHQWNQGRQQGQIARKDEVEIVDGHPANTTGPCAHGEDVHHVHSDLRTVQI